MKLFGFELKRAGKETKQEQPSNIIPREDDGAVVIDSNGFATIVHGVNFVGELGQDEKKNILEYRRISDFTEVSDAIDHVVNEFISIDDSDIRQPIVADTSNVDLSEKIKKRISEEFDTILQLLNFRTEGSRLIREWYIDGRQYFHIIVDENKLSDGIKEIRKMDTLRTKRVREVRREMKDGVEYVVEVREYYTYRQERSGSVALLELSKDSVAEVDSGIYDPEKGFAKSFLDRAIKPANQLAELEDSIVVHRIARAPSRRVFYVDVGKLPRTSAEKYLNSVISKFKNKISYDTSTGRLTSTTKQHSMLEDIFLPRKEGSRGTEVSTLDGANNLGDIDDIIYMRNKLYRALRIPVSRMETDNAFALGRTSEITRDEVKFAKFINELRARYSKLFLKLLKTQLILKKVITENDWKDIEHNLVFRYSTDSQFAELKNIEILNERLDALDKISDHVGTYYSRKWVQRNVLQMTDDEIEEMQQDIESEPAVDDGENF